MADCLVLGAGIVGVSIAIHLAQRGRTVVLVDRRGAGEETSYGNAGLIQREGVAPYFFPQGLGEILRYGLNDRIDMHYHPLALPAVAPFLYRYWRASRPDNYERIKRQYEPLIRHCITEHAALIEAAGAGALIEKQGWYRVFRTAGTRDAVFADARQLARDFGVKHAELDAAAMAAREPGLGQVIVGALHWTEPWNIRDPGALVKAYRALFERLGGTLVRADAMALTRQGAGWALPGGIEAAEAVVALGPWAGDLTSRLGYRLPLGVKRGYHMHYGQPERPLGNWVQDAERGYLLAPMAKGVRLTTGAEFAERDAPSTPVQLDKAEVAAREVLPGLGARLEPAPWRGARPCTPDMMPIIGKAPRHDGLWFAFGHAHHGMTLGPVTGRLVAEMMTGEAPVIDPTPYRAERLLRS
jgi:D-amino-acid dehydrogenase